MKRYIAEEIDYFYWNSINMNDYKQKYELFKDPNDLIECVDWFLKSLIKNHSVTGKEYEMLQEIARWARWGNKLTNEQKVAVVQILTAYWDQRDLIKDPWIL